MLLRAYRHLRPGQDDNFAIISSDSLVGAWDQLTGAIAATAVAVVSVFMVVGGVVIMNIMLAVVTERTHEIGIRKSVGARSQDILNQFLVESSVLAGIGGLIGVALAAILDAAWRPADAGADGCPNQRVDWSGLLGCGGTLFRHLSGPARRQARSHRSPAGGTMTFSTFLSGAGMAMGTIWQHKLRSLLTVLGVIIGTSTIIGVGSIITGLDGAITNILRSFGTNTLIVFKFKVGVRFNLSAEERTRKPLTMRMRVPLRSAAGLWSM